MKILFALFVGAFVFISQNANVFAQTTDSTAATSAFQIGNKRVVVPPPANFVEATSQIPRVKEYFAATEAAGNELLAVHITSEDFELFKKGEYKDLDFYTKVSVSSQLKNSVTTQAGFADFVRVFKTNFPALSDPNGREMKTVLGKLSENLSKLGNEKTTFSLSQPLNLGTFIETPNAYGLILLAQVKFAANGKEDARSILGGMSAIRVRDKILFVYTYKRYEKEQDIADLKAFSKTWINQIALANSLTTK